MSPIRIQRSNARSSPEKAPTSLGPSGHSQRPRQRHCGTGIWPDRDIAGSWRDVDEPCASLPALPPRRARARRGNCRFFDTGTRNLARDGLSAGANEIRTVGPAGGHRRLGRLSLAAVNFGVVYSAWAMRRFSGELKSYRRLRKRRVRARQHEKRSRGTDLRAPGQYGPTPCAGNRRTHENSNCRAA